jgi:hypothetical protein
MRPRKACPPRRSKRIANRLAKHGLTFKRFEQGDPQAITMRAIVETMCPQRFGKAFVYPRTFVLAHGARAIADAILADFARGTRVASALG